jgi:hypothetical protein
MMNTDAGEAQTRIHIMCRLGKGYIPKDIKSGTARICEEKHPNKQARRFFVVYYESRKRELKI